MPKLKPTDTEQAKRIVRSCIASGQQLRAVDNNTLSVKLGISDQTLRNRLNDPGSFTLDELWRIQRALSLNPIQCASIASGKALTSREVRDFILL